MQSDRGWGKKEMKRTNIKGEGEEQGQGDIAFYFVELVV